MDASDREPCPWCAELVSAQARICPSCGRSSLVDLRLYAAIQDGRQRYQIARALGVLGPPVPDLRTLTTALAMPSPVVVRGATLAFARKVSGILEANGLVGSVQPAASQQRVARLGTAGIGVIGAILLVAAGWWAIRAPEPPKPAPGPTGQARAAALAPGPSTAAAGLTTADVARLSIPSVVSLSCPESTGSGFFVTEDIVLTNAHVLCKAGEKIRVRFSDGRRTSGVAIRSDEALDLGLVRVAGAGARPPALADAGSIGVGEKVVMIGSPMGYDFTVHEGTLSNVTNMLGVAYLQFDARVNPGNSGGPLLDSRGRVVGIVSMKRADAEGIGFALPINYSFTRVDFVPLPSGMEQSAGFAQMVAKAESSEREVVGELASMAVRPMLIGAAVDKYKNLLARIVRTGKYAPAYEDVTLKLWRGSKEVCTLKGSVSDWKPVEGRSLASGLDSRARSWIDRNHLDQKFFLGEAPLRWDLCPREDVTPGIELELIGGEAGASRVRLY